MPDNKSQGSPFHAVPETLQCGPWPTKTAFSARYSATRNRPCRTRHDLRPSRHRGHNQHPGRGRNERTTSRSWWTEPWSSWMPWRKVFPLSLSASLPGLIRKPSPAFPNGLA